MNASLSVWLDLCRVIAALAVFIGHSQVLGLAPPWVAAHWHRTAEDAVVAFFVLSGYVIAWSTDRPTATIRDYFEARASRIYSVAIPAVLFALALDGIGMRLDASHYAPDWQYPKLWLHLPLHWLFLGGTWVGPMDPFSMKSYWSLPYEVWYYILFGCTTLLRGRARVVGIVLTLGIMGPRMWLLLPCWWLGVLLYRHRSNLVLPSSAAPILMLGSSLLYLAFVASDGRLAVDRLSRGLYAWFDTWLPAPFVPGGTVHALTDHVVALLFGSFLIGCASSARRFGADTASVIRGLANYSFSFYLIHFSLLVLFAAAGWSNPDSLAYVAIIGATFGLTWVLGQVGEVRRHVYRRAISKLIDSILALRSRREPKHSRS